MSESLEAGRLRRELGIFGATMLGLGSMIGTGVFVSIGIAASVTGASVILAIGLAALVAACNALSSAQLAASHAVAGGTYEYGYRYLNPTLGFSAGWLFLIAKSASAATAALGFAGYALRLAGVDLVWIPVLAVATVVVFVVLVLTGIKRSSHANTIIVAVTLLALGALVALGLPQVLGERSANLLPIAPASGAGGAQAFLYATALMFVAYTGYGRVATLGEEVIEPRRTIPRAIILTMAITAIVYVLVALVAVGAGGARAFAGSSEAMATPLELAARSLSGAPLAAIVAIGATTAMLGVLLNLLLGLSRVVLAMGRQGDLPPVFGKVSGDGRAPTAAVVLVGGGTAILAAVGSVETAWAFSAFTVLLYYAITNLAALKMPKEARLYPRWIAVAGLIACLFLAFWVPVGIWAAGLGLIGVGLVWRRLTRRLWINTKGVNP